MTRTGNKNLRQRSSHNQKPISSTGPQRGTQEARKIHPRSDRMGSHGGLPLQGEADG